MEYSKHGAAPVGVSAHARLPGGHAAGGEF